MTDSLNEKAFEYATVGLNAEHKDVAKHAIRQYLRQHNAEQPTKRESRKRCEFEDTVHLAIREGRRVAPCLDCGFRKEVSGNRIEVQEGK